jgi:hypothetical protein
MTDAAGSSRLTSICIASTPRETIEILCSPERLNSEPVEAILIRLGNSGTAITCETSLLNL